MANLTPVPAWSNATDLANEAVYVVAEIVSERTPSGIPPAPDLVCPDGMRILRWLLSASGPLAEEVVLARLK